MEISIDEDIALENRVTRTMKPNNIESKSVSNSISTYYWSV